ncbi:hypothetical protein PpBr36_03423 [Pyricularia pennisetigena]|uniref:hypothetical protein n=1 Tax=Pyricularia pennisetigena TaxID=1578925 RepID=UPI001153F705|nr:hypothetical protein PpBr36_03423 [Pyricularia pennisetigena]TLS30498.1 hypothetical protein PpBr36_03423 [Pyricularia pennisetigena]
MSNRHTPSPSPSPPRDQRAVGGRGRRRSPSPSHVISGPPPAGGDSWSSSPVQERSSRFGARTDRLRDQSPSETRSCSRPAARRRSRSRSLSSSRSRSRSRDRAGAKQRFGRPGDDNGRPRRRRSLSRSRSRSSSRSDSQSRSELRRHYEDAKGKAAHDAKKENAVKTTAIFLGAIAATTLAVHKFWPKGFPYGPKEEWETREVPKRVQKVKEDLFEKREEVHQKIEDITHGRRPMLEGRPRRSDSTASVGSGNGRRYAEYDRERMYYEDRKGRRFLPAARDREGRPGPELEGRRIDPQPRHEMVYRHQETRYRGDDAARADAGARLVGRSREEVEIHQPPIRSSRLMPEDASQWPRDMPRQNDARRVLQEDTSSRSSLKYAEPEVLNPPSTEIITEHREIVRGRDPSPGRDYERPRDRTPKRKVVETREIIREKATAPPLEHHRESERTRELDLEPKPNMITVERHDTIRQRDVSSRGHKPVRDGQPRETIVEQQEIVRRQAPSLQREHEDKREHNMISKKVVRERREELGDRSSSPHYEYERTREQPREFCQEHRVIRERGISPPRDGDRPRERRSSHEAPDPIEDDYLEPPPRTRRGLSPMPHSRRSDRERMKEQEVAYY